MKCPKCNCDMNDISSFCTQCGTLNPKIFPPKQTSEIQTQQDTSTVEAKTIKKHPDTKNWKFLGILACVAIVIIIIIFSTGNNTKEVPMSLIEQVVMSCKDFKTDKYAMSFTTSDQYDKDSKIDTVNITITAEGAYGYYKTSCTARYQYDRSSDLWSLISVSDWSKKEYTLKDSIIGKEWYVKSTTGGDSVYAVKVTSISGAIATVDLSMKSSVYTGISSGNKLCEISCIQDAEIKGTSLILSAELPDHFYSQKSLGENSNMAEIYIFWDLQQGVTSALTDNIIYIE